MKNIEFEYFYTYSHPKGSVVTPHRHTFFELVYFLKGEGYSRADETDIAYKAGNLIIYPPNTIHNEVHKEETSVICIAFRGENAESFSEPRQFQDESGMIQEIIGNIKSEVRQHLLKFRQMAGYSIGQILILLERLDEGNGKNEDSLNIVTCFIAENLAFEIDLKVLADLSGYSYHRFRHLFKERFGESPKQYIQKARVECAKKMLREQNIKVSDVALSCGFSSFSAFSMIFKKCVGVSPSDYMQGAEKPN